MRDTCIGETRKDKLKLRAHHVLGLLDFFRNPSVNHYDEFRRKKGFFHSDELVNHWIKTSLSLTENPKSKFRYVSGTDSICIRCEHRINCSNLMHENYTIVETFDQYASQNMPDLIMWKKYDSEFIKNLFKIKAWL